MNKTRPLNSLFRTLLILVLGLYIAVISYIWHSTIEDTKANLTQVNSMLSQGVRATLKSHELILRGFAHELITLGALESPENGRELIERMKKIDNGMAGFGLARPDGQLMLVSTIQPGTKLPNLLEKPESRDSFNEALNSKQLRVGRPYFFKPLDSWVVPIRVSIRDNQGNIIAVMTAAYKMHSASVAWANSDLPDNSILALMRDDGHLIFRQPAPLISRNESYEQIFGKTVPQSTIDGVSALNKRKSFINLYLPLYDENYYIAYDYITEYGIHSGAMIAEKAVIITWLQRIIAPSLMLFLFIVGGVWAFRRAMQQQNLTDEKLIFQAKHDSLTGLPNRVSLHEAFNAQAQQSTNQQFSLMLIDLDYFKEINDTLGHHIGDELLKEIGHRLKTLYPSKQIFVSRLGGDEFALLLDNAKLSGDCLEITENIMKLLNHPISIDGLELHVRASIGIAHYPTHGKNSHELLRAADVAMYQAKKLGIGSIIYNRDFDDYSPQRLQFANELSQAIEHDQLVLHYQPKIDIKTGKTVSLEALVRWQHPTHGLLYPDSFINLIEMSEIVHSFTRAVIELALTEKKKLHDLGFHQSVAINLSAKNLLDDSCLKVISAALTNHKLAANEVELELTESAIMHDAERAITLLKRFNEMGINTAIDDFGTGYSSLSYLRKLPVSAMKIDRDFVMGMLKSPQDSNIVQSTIALAHSLNLQVIAEGVENDEILELLREMNCDMAQGYGICRPKPLAELTSWLEKQTESGA